jgi:hypothetical protein
MGNCYLYYLNIHQPDMEKKSELMFQRKRKKTQIIKYSVYIVIWTVRSTYYVYVCIYIYIYNLEFLVQINYLVLQINYILHICSHFQIDATRFKPRFYKTTVPREIDILWLQVCTGQ